VPNGTAVSGVGSQPDAGVVPVTPSSSSNSLCDGWWYHPVANVNFYKSDGKLQWHFYLTVLAQGELGPFVTVSIPFAYVNGLPINPPYAPHFEPSSYDFHSSMLNYQYIPGPGGGTLHSGDVVTLYWNMQGSTGQGAYRYLNCQVPAGYCPG
jgi:hypothetical protein